MQCLIFRFRNKKTELILIADQSEKMKLFLAIILLLTSVFMTLTLAQDSSEETGIRKHFNNAVDTIGKFADDTQKRTLFTTCLQDSSCPTNSVCKVLTCVCNEGYAVDESRSACNGVNGLGISCAALILMIFLVVLNN